MKKILLLLVMVLSVISVTAQNDIRWTRIESPKDKYDFKYFIKVSENDCKAVFAIPHNKPFQATKHSVFIRNYNSDLSEYTETGIPSESPLTLFISGFRDYNVISGSMDENKNPMSQYGEDNRIVITDNNLNPLVTKNYPLHGKKNKFSGAPDLGYSHDSSHLIVVNDEILSLGKPSLKEAPRMKYIDVYDKDLKLVWSDSVNFNLIFGEKTDIQYYHVDYISNKLVITASCMADGMKKIKATLFVVRFDSPQSYKIIMNKVFPYDDFAYQSLLTKEGNVIICGSNMMTMSAPLAPVKRQLFYLSKDVMNPDVEPLYRSYEIDKNFANKYPEFKAWLIEGIRGPFDLVKIGDNIIYCCEVRYVSTSTSSSGSSSTTYHFKHITLLSFNADGEIGWINMINKSVASKQAYNDHFCKAFSVGNNLCIFYYDYADNIAGAKFVEKPRMVTEDKIWVAKAMVTPEGDIMKSMITNIGEHDVRANLPRTERVSENRFLLVGSGTSLSKLGNYFGFYDLD